MIHALEIDELRANGPVIYQPGASPQERWIPKKRGLKARHMFSMPVYFGLSALMDFL
jgi:hypothetical protein